MGRRMPNKARGRPPGAEAVTITNTSLKVEKPADDKNGIGNASTVPDPKQQDTLSSPGAQDDAPRSTLPPSAPVTLPPQLAERFSVVKLLGQGGMGAVYQARDKRLGRDIALKVLRAGCGTVDETLFREARAQASLEHPNACKVYEMGVDGDTRYIVMQLIPGVSLDKSASMLTLEQKVKIMQQIARALHDVHRMGLVHRDIKPSNIMVEEGEQGDHKAYLMDFGLAREVGAEGHTVTGVVAGTPAFMAPEQGRGEIRKLDRRTDVYSLGATMYSLFMGKPPFEATSLWSLLEKISLEDPRPLRKIDPTFPIDLEAVVLKCLEKEPQHRYESAKALDEDLQRFLDGEPVRARDASIAYVVYKKIRKHKLFVSIAAAALMVVTVFTGIWIRSQRIASKQAELSRELGEDIKEIEWLLRTASGLPLHDIEYEREIVQKRLLRIEDRMPTLGEAGEGPSQYALGRGYIALQEYEKALMYLERARNAGYQTPELNYALGIAEGELYRRELNERRKIPMTEYEGNRQSQVDEKYKLAALDHLKLAADARLDSKELVEGLIALYSENFDEAIDLAQKAINKSPWLYEAKKLEGDAHYTRGLIKWGPNSPSLNVEKLLDAFGKASSAYESARRIARSDPGVHNAECELATQMLLAKRDTKEAGVMAPLVEAAKARCQDAVKASSRNEQALGRVAFVYNVHAWTRLQLEGSSSAVIELVQTAMDEAFKVHEGFEGNAFTFYVLGSAWRTRVFLLMNLGLDSSYELEQAIWAYEDSLAKDPAFSWGLNEMCSTMDVRLQRDMSVGIYSAARAKDVFDICGRAVLHDPNSMMANLVMISSNIAYALYLVDMGKSPAEPVGWVMAELGKLSAKGSSLAATLPFELFALYAQARGELESGLDPRPTIAAGFARIGSLGSQEQVQAIYKEMGALFYLVRGDFALRRDMDPGPDLESAITIFDELLLERPLHVDYVIPRVQAGILRLSHAMREKRAALGDFERLETILEPLASGDRFEPRLYKTAAELCALKAQLLKDRRGGGIEEEIEEGMNRVERALKLYPNMAPAHFVKGRLLAMQALGRRDSEARRAGLALAKGAFGQAVRINAWLEPKVKEQLSWLENE